uniref:Dynamin n=1 Tax=Solanum tuberosum TaxID=4113 RepID=M1CFB0_SOLTU
MEGKNEEMSTSELSGGARNHHIFQDIFVKSLEEVDPCEDLTDDDIRTAIKKPRVPKLFYLCQKSHFKFTSEG